MPSRRDISYDEFVGTSRGNLEHQHSQGNQHQLHHQLHHQHHNHHNSSRSVGNHNENFHHHDEHLPLPSILALQHLCETAKNERGWEEVRSWFFTDSTKECKSALSQKGENGTTTMHYVCKNNTPLDIIEKMINSNGKLLELRDSHGWCPLHYACHFGANKDVIKVFILSCPKIVKREDSKGRNPLHFAIGNKCKSEPFTISVFTLLTQSGAARKIDSKGILVIREIIFL